MSSSSSCQGLGSVTSPVVMCVEKVVMVSALGVLKAIAYIEE